MRTTPVCCLTGNSRKGQSSTNTMQRASWFPSKEAARAQSARTIVAQFGGKRGHRMVNHEAGVPEAPWLRKWARSSAMPYAVNCLNFDDFAPRASPHHIIGNLNWISVRCSPTATSGNQAAACKRLQPGGQRGSCRVFPNTGVPEALPSAVSDYGPSQSVHAPWSAERRPWLSLQKTLFPTSKRI